MGLGAHREYQRTKEEVDLKLELSQEELAFLQEALGWAQYRFDEKASEYMNIKGYRENQYLPKMQMFNQVREKLRTAR